MDERYDAIVVGVGGMGSAALAHLAIRGARVCGVERYGTAHDQGSSHGDTRIIRKAYLEHPDYVPLLLRAYELWDELQQESGRQLLVETGLLAMGHPDSLSMRGQAACYRAHSLDHERLQRQDVLDRFPQWCLPSKIAAFWDPAGGFLKVEDCVRAHIHWALRNGAQLLLHETALHWCRDGSGVVVQTDRRTIVADRLLLTGGAWAQSELAAVGVGLHVLRKPMFWYDAPVCFDIGKFCCFLVEWEGGIYYGFPRIDGRGLKVARHSPGGQAVKDPDALEREMLSGDEEPVLEFLASCLPGVGGLLRHEPCMYTMSPDKHFIIDVHPNYDNVVLAAGFSGHGFKFATVVGEVLADFALVGSTCHPIGFLRLGRLL